MSDSCQSIVDIDVTEQEAAAAGERLRSWLLQLGVIDVKTGDNVLSNGPGHFPGPNLGGCFDAVSNKAIAQLRALATCGVAIAVGRGVFDTGGNGVRLVCSSCAGEITDDEAYVEAGSAWANGDDDTTYACPQCGFAQPVADWNGPFVFGLGCMAVEFYNWPPLSERFIDSVAQRLGHRVRVARQHT